MNVYSALKPAWHLDKIAQLRSGLDIVPLHIHFVISDLCNQDCHFCSYRMSGGFSAEDFADEAGHKNPVRFVPTARAFEILDDCAEMGVRAIEFTGGGEPTVHVEHVEIIEHAQHLGLQTGLVTNGVKLTDRKAFRNLDWLRISLDAGTGKTYEAIRSSKQWMRVLNNIRMVADYEKPLKGIGFVVTRENHRELVAATGIARDAGFDYIRVSAMFSYEGSAHYDGILDEIASQRAEARKLATDKFSIVDNFKSRVDDLDQGRPEYQFCGQQQFVLYIGGNLKVYTCCTNAYTKHGEIGDLSNMRFADWLKSHRRYEFDARKCHHCQFHDKNRLINYLTQGKPKHADFV